LGSFLFSSRSSFFGSWASEVFLAILFFPPSPGVHPPPFFVPTVFGLLYPAVGRWKVPAQVLFCGAIGFCQPSASLRPPSFLLDASTPRPIETRSPDFLENELIQLTLELYNISLSSLLQVFPSVIPLLAGAAE